ncbi:MAG: CDP-alcohol phosphatidyltransferase family protein [Acidobacteriaceae bacterium]
MKQATAFVPAKRVHLALTAAMERRALQWMAARAPRWLSSDQLTVLGFVAQLGASAGYVLARHHRGALLAVIGCIVLNWFGDSLDGTLARVRCQQRPRYGFYVDHMIDVFGAVALMGGLSFSGFLHWQIAMAMLLAFLILACESYLATYTLSHFQLSQGLFGPTEIRLLLIAGNLALLRSSYANVFGHRVLLFDLGGTIATICMAVAAVMLTVQHTAQLYREEPLP